MKAYHSTYVDAPTTYSTYSLVSSCSPVVCRPQEKGLFPTHGYDCATLFKNARFKLGIALRNAGLHSTDYARQALATVKVSNAGAYRHAVAPPTQLW